MLGVKTNYEAWIFPIWRLRQPALACQPCDPTVQRLYGWSAAKRTSRRGAAWRGVTYRSRPAIAAHLCPHYAPPQQSSRFITVTTCAAEKPCAVMRYFANPACAYHAQHWQQHQP